MKKYMEVVPKEGWPIKYRANDRVYKKDSHK